MPKYLCYCLSDSHKEEDAVEVQANNERLAAERFIAQLDGEQCEYPPARLVMLRRVDGPVSTWLLFETTLRAEPVYSAKLKASVV